MRKQKITDVEGKPRVASSNKYEHIPPVTDVVLPVPPRRLRRLHDLYLRIGINVVTPRRQECIDILTSLIHIPGDVHCETRRFWDSKSEEEGECSRDTTESDEDAPHLVKVVRNDGSVSSSSQGRLVGVDNYDTDNCAG